VSETENSRGIFGLSDRWIFKFFFLWLIKARWKIFRELEELKLPFYSCWISYSMCPRHTQRHFGPIMLVTVKVLLQDWLTPLAIKVLDQWPLGPACVLPDLKFSSELINLNQSVFGDRPIPICPFPTPKLIIPGRPFFLTKVVAPLVALFEKFGKLGSFVFYVVKIFAVVKPSCSPRSMVKKKTHFNPFWRLTISRLPFPTPKLIYGRTFFYQRCRTLGL